MLDLNFKDKGKKLAFTLAEILITLGIIGVVAAISIPTLITNIQKKSAETKLKHFYAEINNAFKLAAAETGVDVDGWVVKQKNYNENDLTEFLNTYVTPFLKVSSMKSVEKNPYSPAQCRMLVVLQNSTAFSIYVDQNGMDIFFHPNPEKYDYANPNQSFAFQAAKVKTVNDYNGGYNSMDFVEPYSMSWDGTMSMLKNDSLYGCNKTSRSKQYCTKYIQMNDWKIPHDYPW